MAIPATRPSPAAARSSHPHRLGPAAVSQLPAVFHKFLATVTFPLKGRRLMFKRLVAMAGSLVMALAGLTVTESLAQAGTAAGACRHVTGPFHMCYFENTAST